MHSGRPQDPMVVRLRTSQSEQPAQRQYTERDPIERAHVARTRRNMRLYAFGAIALVLLLIVGYGLWHFLGSKSDAEVIEDVSELIRLPEETPTIATVTDMAPLSRQAFFEHAQLGDIVLMFPQTSRAILYRPSEHKIIEVAPITVDVQ